MVPIRLRILDLRITLCRFSNYHLWFPKYHTASFYPCLEWYACFLLDETTIKWAVNKNTNHSALYKLELIVFLEFKIHMALIRYIGWQKKLSFNFKRYFRIKITLIGVSSIFSILMVNGFWKMSPYSFSMLQLLIRRVCILVFTWPSPTARDAMFVLEHSM
jgi:hypothetical protein